MLATGLFTENKIYKVLSPEADEGKTYSIQYFLKNMDDYDKYQKEFAPKLH